MDNVDTNIKKKKRDLNKYDYDYDGNYDITEIYLFDKTKKRRRNKDVVDKFMIDFLSSLIISS